MLQSLRGSLDFESLLRPRAPWQRDPRSALSDAQLASSIAHEGDEGRLTQFLQRLTSGRPVSVAVVGGSISAGATYTTLRGDKASWLWHRLFFDWLNSTFPNGAHVHFNGALPASTPGYVESCVTLHVPVAADIVFVEYAANFDNPRAYERLVRRLIRYPHRPAIVLLNMPWFWGEGLARNIRADTPVSVGDLNFTFHESHSAENSITLLAQYYGVASLSMRNALFHETQGNATDRQRLKDVMLDRVHPSVIGHQYAAAIAVSFLRRQILLMAARTAAGGATLPSARRPESALRRERPPPMYAGNDDADSYVCVRGKELLPLVHSYGGWEYRVEGDRFSNPKPGLVATKPGERLELCWQPPKRWRKASIKLGYLTSYEQMGRARYSCSGACSCHGGVIDAFTPLRRSVHWVTTIVVLGPDGQRQGLRRGSSHSTGRQMADATGCCMLAISTVADPDAARNKFKVLSFYVASRLHSATAWLHGKTIWNIEHGLEDGSFTDPEINSSMRVPGKSTLMTARRGAVGGRRSRASRESLRGSGGAALARRSKSRRSGR